MHSSQAFPPPPFTPPSPSPFHFAVRQSFMRKGFIENPCLGIYSGLCHELWQHRISLLLYSSKYLNKVITVKSTAPSVGVDLGTCRCSPREEQEELATKAAFDGKAMLTFGREGSLYPQTVPCRTRIVFLKPRSASLGYGSDST